MQQLFSSMSGCKNTFDKSRRNLKVAPQRSDSGKSSTSSLTMSQILNLKLQQIYYIQVLQATLLRVYLFRHQKK